MLPYLYLDRWHRIHVLNHRIKQGVILGEAYLIIIYSEPKGEVSVHSTDNANVLRPPEDSLCGDRKALTHARFLVLTLELGSESTKNQQKASCN